MSAPNFGLSAAVLILFCALIQRVAARRTRERLEFEAKLSRLFNEVRSDSTTRERFNRMVPKDPPKL